MKLGSQLIIEWYAGKKETYEDLDEVGQDPVSQAGLCRPLQAWLGPGWGLREGVVCVRRMGMGRR